MHTDASFSKQTTTTAVDACMHTPTTQIAHNVTLRIVPVRKAYPLDY